jgi:hypothetical protein
MLNFGSAKGSMLEFKGQSVVTPWDRLKKHIFESYPVYSGPRIDGFDNLLLKGLEYQKESEMVWIIDENAIEIEKATLREEFPWHYRPNGDGLNFIHEFPRSGKRTGRSYSWGDIKLVPTGGYAHGYLKNKIIGTNHDADFDIFMISFHEAEADRNFAKLKERFSDAQHVKNVEGIGEAHKECAKRSKTDMVYIVDADADVLGSFKFDYIPPLAKRSNTTYVWSARNPINGLEYGYGGIKLFPKQQLLEMGHNLPDFSTGVAFYQPVSDVSNVTNFNKDPYRTWRSAFRECVKLASKVNPNQVDKETIERLEAWTTIDNGARFGRYCIKGALEGKTYGEENKDNVEALNKINDFEWLREQFVESMKKRISAD